MLKNYNSAPKDYNLNNKELDRRQKLYEQAYNDKNSLQRVYDGFFIKKTAMQGNIT
jgi:hypothetical protein